jgi:hypothetical protein
MDAPFIEVEGPTKERFRVSKRLLLAILNADQFLTEQAGRKSQAVLHAPTKKRRSPEAVLAVAAQPSTARKEEKNLHQDHLEKTHEDLAPTEDPASSSSEDGVDDASVVQTVSTDQSINSSTGSSKKRKAALRNTAIFSASPPSKKLAFKKAHSSASSSKEDHGALGAQWELMYQRLTLFHQTHGHCRVPRKCNVERLERWVRSQREERKRIERGKKSSRLTPERIGKLDSLCFVWDGSCKP